jgi:16S rRNA (cytosine1402-N4)-methyltransferase
MSETMTLSLACDAFHIPVMSGEVINYLLPVGSSRPNNNNVNVIIIDATIGGGGHAEQILSHLTNCIVIGIDWDLEAINYCQSRLAHYPNLYLFHGSYTELDILVQEFPEGLIKGVLFDYGVSNYQLKNPARGFSYQHDGPLDMRFCQIRPVKKAQEIIKESSLESLTRIFLQFGEERLARKIARIIYENRKKINTTVELANLIRSVIPRRYQNKTLARIFQALRIVVNDELTNIKLGLAKAFNILSPGGRIICISYHSLEDRIVKSFFKEQAKLNNLNILTKKPIRPTPNELTVNPQARSARLRVAEKLYKNP